MSLSRVGSTAHLAAPKLATMSTISGLLVIQRPLKYIKTLVSHDNRHIHRTCNSIVDEQCESDLKKL